MMTVYTGPGCAWCLTLKKYLTYKEVPFKEISINEPGAAEEIQRLTGGLQTVPVTTNGKSVMTGYNLPKLTEMIAEIA